MPSNMSMPQGSTRLHQVLAEQVLVARTRLPASFQTEHNEDDDGRVLHPHLIQDGEAEGSAPVGAAGAVPETITPTISQPKETLKVIWHC